MTTPKASKTAAIAWVVGITLMLAYEAWSITNAVPGDTLSETVWAASYQHPLVPFLVGFLMGHFFWQRDFNGTQGKR